MKSYTLVEAGLDSSGTPVFKFETELHSGADLDGKFQIQFAAIDYEGGPKFAVNSPQGLQAVFSEEDSRQLALRLAEKEKYRIAANYENTSWEESDGVATVLLGRDVGHDVDYHEVYELSGEDLMAVKEIAAIIEGDE